MLIPYLFIIHKKTKKCLVKTNYEYTSNITSYNTILDNLTYYCYKSLDIELLHKTLEK